MAESWFFNRDEYRAYCLAIRKQFDRYKHETNPTRIDEIVNATQQILYENRHPEMIKYPNSVGGVTHERDEPACTKEFCKTGFGNLVPADE